MQGRELDRDELHRWLWAHAQDNRMHLVEVYQTHVARVFRVNNSTLSAAIRDLKEAGKIRKIRSKQGNIGVYTVRDPNPDST